MLLPLFGRLSGAPPVPPPWVRVSAPAKVTILTVPGTASPLANCVIAVVPVTAIEDPATDHTSVVDALASVAWTPPPICTAFKWLVESTFQRLFQLLPSYCATWPVLVFHHNIPDVGEPGGAMAANRPSAVPRQLLMSM